MKVILYLNELISLPNSERRKGKQKSFKDLYVRNVNSRMKRKSNKLSKSFVVRDRSVITYVIQFNEKFLKARK